MNKNILFSIVISLLILSDQAAQTGEKPMKTPLITKKLSTLSPAKHDLKTFKKKGYKKLEDKVLNIINTEKQFTPTGINREYYLDLAEKIVRAAQKWQDKKGAIIDPVEKKEHGQTSPRYAAPGAVLLSFGRCEDLKKSIFKTMDYSCRQLARGKAKSPDFWMRELMTAYMCLQDVADKKHLDRWAKDLSSVTPEKIYWKVKPDGKNLDKLHNWTVYAAAGEIMRAKAGLSPNKKIICGKGFFDKYMPAQFGHFTSYGMYRDPGDPFTYDITTRLQFATAIAFGYDGKVKDELNEILRRGAITQLLYLSPEGFVPFGGRSSQFHFQEMIIAALCELEANRYKESNPKLAGAFKRQAHLSAKSIERWMEMKPFRHLKNGFDPQTKHGLDTYGKYSVYSLLAASFAGLAAIYADDEIKESPCPAEIGGINLQLYPEFHKVFANCQDTFLEIDTQADLHYDATGLGRFCRTGVPLELGLGMPICANPNYLLMKDVKPEQNLTIGPEWYAEGKWTRLADLSKTLSSKCVVESETKEKVAFKIVYKILSSKTEIIENYVLEKGKLNYSVKVLNNKADTIRLLVPLLDNNGISKAKTTAKAGNVQVNYLGSKFDVAFDPALKSNIDDKIAANRNALYKCLIIEKKGNKIEAVMTLE